MSEARMASAALMSTAICEDLTAIDLFAGAGGATQGLVDAGYRVLAAIEVDRDAGATYALNHPNVRLVVADIGTVAADVLRSELEIAQGSLTLLTACPPCQGFSTLGSNDPTDPRNDLTLDVWRFLRVFKPAAFVLENVPGIRSDHRLRRVVRQARAIGYRVHEFDIDATEFGVPQRRRRFIVIGLHLSETVFAGRLADLVPSELSSVTLAAGPALASVAGLTAEEDPLHRARTSRPVTQARIRAVPVGGTRFDLPPEHQLPCHSKLAGRHATGSYGRIRAEHPAPTMTTRCTTPACGPFIHPTEHRGLTLREAAVLQTFPIWYRFVGGYDSIERQIGNAVPVRMAAGLGHAVRRLLNPEEAR